MQAARTLHIFRAEIIRTDADKTLYAVWNPANTIADSQNVKVDIAGAGRMYKITPQTTGTYCIESTGSLDTKAVLYNCGGNSACNE